MRVKLTLSTHMVPVAPMQERDSCAPSGLAGGGVVEDSDTRHKDIVRVPEHLSLYASSSAIEYAPSWMRNR